MEQTVNERVKILRKELRLTQTQFGKKLGFSQANVTSMETGVDGAGVTVETARKICEVFEVNSDWLLQGKGDMFKIKLPPLNSKPALWEPDFDIKKELKQRMKEMEKKYTDLGQDLAVINYMLGKSETIELPGYVQAVA